MGYFNFKFLKKLLSKIFTKKALVYIIIFLLIIIFKSNVFGATTPTEGVNDVYEEIRNQQLDRQNTLVFFLYPPFYQNTDMWQHVFLPLFQKCNSEGYFLWVEDFYNNNVNTNETLISIRLLKEPNSISNGNYLSTNGKTYTIKKAVFNNAELHTITYYHDTNSANDVVSYSDISILINLQRFKSPALLELENLIARRQAGLSEDYTTILNQMGSYLDNLNSINNQLLSTINSFTNVLNQISSNTSNNYSQQLGVITNKIDDILTDNETIISQNNDMIQQQQQINQNLEQVSSDLKDIKNTLTDSTVDSTASDLPSINVTDTTENGIDNIFSSIYNAFCVGQAQDIVFPIPFTNKNITLSPYYVKDMLENNGASWVYTFIQAFWGYLIGRFIIKDVSNKINKIKSGNIENIQNNNIKEDML